MTDPALKPFFVLVAIVAVMLFAVWFGVTAGPQPANCWHGVCH
jgi:uncharacterized protein involved in response to NO